jgi:hypothetical protein
MERAFGRKDSPAPFWTDSLGGGFVQRDSMDVFGQPRIARIQND